MRKIASYTAKVADICVKCCKPIEPGQGIGWLRDADRKGYFHEECASLPTQEALTMVRVQDQEARAGYRYVRVQDLGGAQALLPEHPVATRLATPVKVPNADGILINQTTLNEMVAQAVAQLPRISVTVVVRDKADVEAALQLLTTELFARTGVQRI
jgi:hypothetical protein